MAATLYLNNCRELDLLLAYLHLPPKAIEISRKKKYGSLGNTVLLIANFLYIYYVLNSPFLLNLMNEVCRPFDLMEVELRSLLRTGRCTRNSFRL